MSDQATTFTEEHPGFFQKRTQLPLDELVKRETDAETGAPTVIQDLFDYWQERSRGAPPAIETFEPQRHARVERLVAGELPAGDGVAHGLLNLALRAHPDLLQKFTHLDVEGVLVHDLPLSTLASHPG